MQTYFFLILGMHRSGTSFLAKCLNVSGVYLGKNLLLSHTISKANPKGFWENQDFRKLSEKLLKENNGSWHQITSNLKCSNTIKQDYKKIVDKLVSESHFVSGIKDPRLLLIHDLILDVFPDNKIYVGIFRHPLKVVESLKIRNNFEYQKSLALWKAYNLKLLDYITKNNGFLFDFDWPKEKLLSEISQFIKKNGLLNTDLNLEYSEDLLRSNKSFDSTYTIPQEIENLYEKLKERSLQNNAINSVPITFSIDEAREIMSKMNRIVNEFSEPKKIDNKSNTLYSKIQKKKIRIRKILKKITN